MDNLQILKRKSTDFQQKPTVFQKKIYNFLKGDLQIFKKISSDL